MKLKHIFSRMVLFACMLCVNNSFSQIILASNGFEGGDTWTVNSGTPTPNELTGSTDTPANSRIKSGSKSWLINNTTETVEFSSETITGNTGVKAIVHISSTSTSGGGIDSSDYIRIWANINGTGFPTDADIELTGTSNAKWDYNANLTATTVAGTSILITAPQGGTNANNYATLVITIPDGSTSVALKIEAKNNSENELWNIDDVTLSANNTNPTVGFDTTTSTETEMSSTFTSANIPITAINYDGNQIDIDVNITGGTAESGDYTFTSPTSLSFTANETKNITFDIHDDADSENETLIFTITEISNVTGLFISQATHTVTIADDDIPNIIISEIMYNNPSTDDEWIELYNADVNSIDISSWTIENTSASFIYTIPATSIPVGGYITIAVGSNGDGIFNNDSPFTPDLNSLGVANEDVKNTNSTNKLNNSSSTITLKNGSAIIDIVTYDDDDAGGESDGGGVSFEITNTNIDNSVTGSNWQNSVFKGGSPKRVSGSAWIGITDNTWSSATNWLVGVPITTSDVVIPSGLTNYPTVVSAVTVNSVTIESGATLVAQSTFAGAITYKRNLATTNWYLLSSPVSGETIEDLITNHTFATGTAPSIGLAPYDNSQPTATVWDYQTTVSTGSLANGKGYSVKLNTTGDVSFSGILNTSNVSISLTQGFGSGGDNFNLLGNPFTSFIDSDNFLLTNTSELTSQTIWLWNQATDSYDTKITADAFKIAPGQGFFVEANTTNNVTFAESIQGHKTSDTFQRTSSRSEVHLFLNDDENNTRYSKIYYINGTTTGFDNGYDGELFGGSQNSFEIYSHLLTDNQNKKYQIQSLPNSNYESMIIPVGIKAVAGKEITFSVETLNLPTELKVFLEDKVTNTFIRLDEANTDYTTTLSETLHGVGRFYIHTSTSVLTVDDASLSTIHIYKPDVSTVRIVGLPQGNTSVKLYNVFGKELISSSFDNNIKDISLPKLATGMYIVEIQTEAGKLNKKIILE